MILTATTSGPAENLQTTCATMIGHVGCCSLRDWSFHRGDYSWHGTTPGRDTGLPYVRLCVRVYACMIIILYYCGRSVFPRARVRTCILTYMRTCVRAQVLVRTRVRACVFRLLFGYRRSCSASEMFVINDIIFI